MTEERERELLRHVPTLRSAEELTGFREQLVAQGETPSAALMVAILQKDRALSPARQRRE